MIDIQPFIYSRTKEKDYQFLRRPSENIWPWPNFGGWIGIRQPG